MAADQSDSPQLADKYYFVVRRLHSLSGLVPVGVFLVVHLISNAAIMVPAEEGKDPGWAFQEQVERIHALEPLLVPIEIVGIFLPLAFHAILGFQIMLTAHPNAHH